MGEIWQDGCYLRRTYSSIKDNSYQIAAEGKTGYGNAN